MPAAIKSIFGGFSDPPVITTDPDEKKTDPYIKAEVIPSRYTGANFKVGRAKKGRGKEAYFSKDYLTFAASDQNKGKVDDYIDATTAARREATASKAKNIDARDFKYASPPKKSTGPGSHFGTFDGKPVPHQEEYKVAKRGEPTPKAKCGFPKNIVTQPGKKGTFGFVGTLFSKYEGPAKGDEFDALNKLERERWKASKAKMITTAIFKSTVKTGKMFDEKGNSGISSAFDHYDPPEEKKPKKAAKKPAEDKSKIEGRPVFRYAPAPKSGQSGCLNPFPNTHDKGDSYDALKLKAKEAKDKAPKPLGGSWKPVSGPKSSVVRSLLRTYY